MAGSLHYNGNAFDFRIGGVSVREIRRAVGKDFDVIKHTTHFHVEYDPDE